MRPTAWNMLYAMRDGHRITIKTGMALCKTSAVPQRALEIRDCPEVDDVVLNKRVPGHNHHEWWIPGAINSATKKPAKPVVVAEHTRKACGRCEHTLEMDL